MKMKSHKYCLNKYPEQPHTFKLDCRFTNCYIYKYNKWDFMNVESGTS